MSLENLKFGDYVKLAEGTRWIDVTPGKAYEVLSIDQFTREFTFNDDVGDEREQFLDDDDFVIAHSFHPNDTVRLKSGAPFTTGAYTAEVDSARDDIVLLNHGSWLPVDAVEKVEAWLPEGDGWTEYEGGGNPAPGAKVEWLLDWERRTRVYTHDTSQSDLLLWDEHIVAYRVVEPAPAPAAEPAAETKPKFKVGDVVNVARVVESEDGWDNAWTHSMNCFVNNGIAYEVEGVSKYGVRLSDTHYEFPHGALDYSDTELPEGTYTGRISGLVEHGDNKLTLTLELDTAQFRAGLATMQSGLADQFQRIADALRAA